MQHTPWKPRQRRPDRLPTTAPPDTLRIDRSPAAPRWNLPSIPCTPPVSKSGKPPANASPPATRAPFLRVHPARSHARRARLTQRPPPPRADQISRRSNLAPVKSRALHPSGEPRRRRACRLAAARRCVGARLVALQLRGPVRWAAAAADASAARRGACAAAARCCDVSHLARRLLPDAGEMQMLQKWRLPEKCV